MDSGKPTKVLLAIKNDSNIKELKNALEALGCSVDIAQTGISALRLISQKAAYDLLIIEMIFDEISGFALHLAEKKKNVFCKTIALNNLGSILCEFGNMIGIDKILDASGGVEKTSVGKENFIKTIIHEVSMLCKKTEYRF